MEAEIDDLYNRLTRLEKSCEEKNEKMEKLSQQIEKLNKKIREQIERDDRARNLNDVRQLLDTVKVGHQGGMTLDVPCNIYYFSFSYR